MNFHVANFIFVFRGIIRSFSVNNNRQFLPFLLRMQGYLYRQDHNIIKVFIL